MTYQDPDPLRRGLDPSLNRNSDLRANADASIAMWGWIAGIVVLVLMLVFLFGSVTENTRTTDINRSPAAPMITAPPPNTATAPSRAPSPSETTGQSQQ